MTRVARSFAIGLSALACLTSAASGVEPAAGLAGAFEGMAGVRVERKSSFEANYADTQCVDVSLAGSNDKIGFVCRSSNKAFAADMGITAYDDLAPGSRPQRRPATGLVVGTPMAQYAMAPFAAGKDRIAGADVDCDTESGATYRATATCHVAVSGFDQPVVTYSNFVLKYHTDDRRGIPRAQIARIWERLARR